MRRNAADEQHRMAGDTTEAFAPRMTPGQQYDDAAISLRTLAGMDTAIRNLRVGIVSSDPVHLDDLVESDDDAARQR